MNEAEIARILASRPDVKRKEIEEYEELLGLNRQSKGRPGARITKRRHRTLEIQRNRFNELHKKLFG